MIVFTQHEHSTASLCKQYIDDIVGAALCLEEEVQCSNDSVVDFNSSIIYTRTIPHSSIRFIYN